MTAAGLRRHWFAILLVVWAWVLFGLLVLADVRLGLYRQVSARTRAHAIPVALSQLYHGHPHDYTARLGVALAFRGPEPLDELLKVYSKPTAPTDGGTYYWTADDRGLGDFVNLAFRVYGPKPRSLARFWFLLLAASLALFQLAYRREPGALLAPGLVMFGLLAYAHACPHVGDIELGDGTRWQEAFGLHESRTFEAVAVLAWLHLALLAYRGGDRAAWLAALPQVVLLLFLYHARSSLGWMYLALFVLAGVRIIADRTRLTAPFVVAGLLAVSLVALHQYRRAVYHPAYFQDRGSRAFWHNALMGFSYHPHLRESLATGIDDTKAIELVLRELRETEDPRLTPDWTLERIGCATGGVIQFDWTAYEAAARDVYFGVWRRDPARALACYAYHKPRDLASHTGQVARLLGEDVFAGRANLLAIGLGLVAGVLVVGRLRFCHDGDSREQLRGMLAPAAVLLAFSTVPAMAFYAALPTLAGFFVASPLVLGVLGVRPGTSRSRPEKL
jgi:hypothetical protein